MNSENRTRLMLAATTAVVILLAGLQFEQAAAADNGLRWRGFNEGLAEAKKTNKKILIDVYTDWCGWCKKMDAQTYANKTVASYLGKKYVIIKLNAESDKRVTYRNQSFTERELAAAFGVNGYPSTLFLKPDGEPITIYPGFADAQRFKQVLSFIGDDHYLTKKFEEYMFE